LGGLDRIQVFALYVLDERDFEKAVVGYILDDHRDFRDSSELRGAPTALTGN
jgi:hypothetical protein